VTRLVALLSLGLVACVTDHSALAKRDPPGAGGTAGGGGADGAAGGSAAGGTGGGQLEAGTDADAEPPGQSELTVLHGVVDAETIAFCFARMTEGGVELVGDPIPKSGLTHGRALALSDIAGIDLALDDVQPFVVAGDAALLGSGDCAALVAQASVVVDAGAADAGTDAAPADPALRARSLALIPKGTLAGGYSYLMVAAGCLGAPSHTHSLEESICGSGYAPGSPTLTPVVVQMSRTAKPGKLGLQFVHASVATTAVDVTSLPPTGSTLSPLVIAYGVVPGAIEPKPPNLSYGVAAYGAPISTASLRVAFSTGSTTSIDLPWSGMLAAGGVSAVEDGRSYALVLVGPSIHIGKDAWWNAPAVTLIPTDPQ
jgi:hypothetical protein